MTATDSIILNGAPHELGQACSVTRLLELLALHGPVVVEHNGTALFPQHFDCTMIAPGDTVEIVSIVAGG